MAEAIRGKETDGHWSFSDTKTANPQRDGLGAYHDQGGEGQIDVRSKGH
jgi:hypothetical protein